MWSTGLILTILFGIVSSDEFVGTWLEALRQCQGKGQGILTPIQRDLDDLRGKLTDSSPVWLGGRRVHTSWTWTDGKPFYSYTGCYEHQPSIILNYTDVSEVYDCFQKCSMSYKYALLKDDKCACYDDIGGLRKVNDDNCNHKCEENFEVVCGGAGYLSVYQKHPNEFSWDHRLYSEYDDCAYLYRSGETNSEPVIRSDKCNSQAVNAKPSLCVSGGGDITRTSLYVWWNQACRSKKRLAHIRQSDKPPFQNLIGTEEQYWIGLRRNTVWMWLNGTAIPDVSEGRGYCLAATEDNTRRIRVMAYDCTSKLRVLCNKDVDFTTSTATPTTSTTTATTTTTTVTTSTTTQTTTTTMMTTTTIPTTTRSTTFSSTTPTKSTSTRVTTSTSSTASSSTAATQSSSSASTTSSSSTTSTPTTNTSPLINNLTRSATSSVNVERSSTTSPLETTEVSKTTSQIRVSSISSISNYTATTDALTVDSTPLNGHGNGVNLLALYISLGIIGGLCLLVVVLVAFVRMTRNYKIGQTVIYHVEKLTRRSLSQGSQSSSTPDSPVREDHSDLWSKTSKRVKLQSVKDDNHIRWRDENWAFGEDDNVFTDNPVHDWKSPANGRVITRANLTGPDAMRSVHFEDETGTPRHSRIQERSSD